MKKLLSLFLSATLVFGMLPAQVLAADLSGKTQESKVTSIAEDVVWGSDYDSTDKFTISSVSDLIAFAQMVNGSDDHPGKDFLGKTVYLEADLDLSDTTWVPIGSTNSDDGETHNAEFAGTFDGQDHSVSNISLDFGQTDEPLYDAGGFFGIVSGTVQNLTVNISVTAAADYLGGIAGYLKGGSKIVNCSTSGSITGEKFDGFDCGSYSGGIAGFTDFSTASKGITIENCCSAMTIVTGASTSIGGILGNGGNDAVTIVNCENTGAITGGDNVGGIVGDLNGVIRGCTNSGQVTSVGSECIGGIVGRATGATIENCSNTGTVSAINASGVGGIVGFVYADTSVSGCNNAGNISGSANIGGVVGLNSVDNGAGLGYTITDCTNSGDVSGTNNIGGIAGATRAFNKTTNTSPVGTIEVSRCINSGVVTGSEHVGGIVGSHNASSNKNTAIAQPAMVTGCINTGTVPEKGGAIVGYNNDNSGNSGNEKKPGIVEENFWPETLGAPGIAAGSGSADEEAPEAVKNNSSYDEDGNLTTPVTKDDGEQLDTMSKVVEEIFGGDADNIPETLKATVTFENNGHGTALEAQKVVIGTEIELPAMDNDGYWTFLGWMVDDQLIEGDSYTVTKDVTFKASWRDDTPSGGGTVVGPSKYAISVPTVDNGSVSVSPTAATKGKTVTITATPDAGYEVDAVSVTDRKGKAVKVTANSDGTYSFTMPASKVDVSVSFKQKGEEPTPPVVDNPFTDVAKDAYYYDAVLWAVDNKITNGTSATTFSPALACTRAQMICFLWNQAGQPAPKGDEMPFTDVLEGTYYHDAIQWAVEEGLAAGTSSTTFSPNATLTRAQTVTFLWRAAGEPAVNVDSSFTDVADGAYYADAVAWAVQNGVTNGTGATTFSPDNDCTRGQIVTFLYRAAGN